MRNEIRHNESDEAERYFMRVDDFLLVTGAARKVCATLAKTHVQTTRHSYASIVNDKLLAHAVSMSRIIPRREATSDLLWDLSSVSALSRCILDAYHTLAYLAIEDVSEDERNFRYCLLSLHDSRRRLKVAEALASSPSVLEQLKGEFVQVQEELQESKFLAALPEKERKSLLKEPPDFYNSRSERNKASGVDDAFYVSAQIYLSQFVHTHGFGIHQLTTFAARTSDSYRQMNVPIAFSAIFIARAILGMIKLFGINEDLLLQQEECTLITEYSAMASSSAIE